MKDSSWMTPRARMQMEQDYKARAEAPPSEPKGYLRNCLISARIDGPNIFEIDLEGNVYACLDGYAILPMEEYVRLKEAAGE